jgi:NADPH-dependent 2,4-dienoyl-CoA reductase/sulfur reductase-like enzyme/Fe-S-cluster-containing hydrogenase component 2/pSer/pThr/pTyr-binding forkhead associated (FHA) protein/CRP-like cAMP-binding protein
MANAQITYVIVGNGIAGVTAAEDLRAQDPTGLITIVADDPFPVYYRPALKDYLASQMPEEKLWARPSSFYQEQRIGFIAGRVVGIDPGQHMVQLHSGKALNYQKLLLAQGARSKRLNCPGTDLAGVSTLRTVADYQEILRHLKNITRVVICGSGTLALESAEMLQKRGCKVTHLLRGTTLWSDILDPAASDLVLHEEQRAGIDVQLNKEIAEIVGKKGKVSSVITNGGEHISCELVLIAIGIEPNLDFIKASGIAYKQGIQVDNYMRTNVPDIYAAGDVIETTDVVSGRARLLGQWYPAIQQARTAAHNMYTALHTLPGSQPDHYSWSHEYRNYYNASFLFGLDFVSIGQTTVPQRQGSTLYKEIIALPEPRNYRKVILQHGILVGALFLGKRDQALAFKRAIDHHIDVTTIVAHLFEDSFDFEGWLDKQRVPSALLTVSQQKNIKLPMDNAGIGTKQAERVLADEQQEQEAILVPIIHPKVVIALREFPLHQRKHITIGRQEHADLLIEHRSVSRYHAQITYSDGSYMLCDKGSSNGTLLNNAALVPGKGHLLQQNDHIRLGDVQFRFERRPGTFQHLQGTALDANSTRRIPEDILAMLPPTPTLVLMGQQSKLAIVPLALEKRTTIGRAQENVIALDDTATSHTHAELFPSKDGFYIRDLDSRNGVFVNKIKINNAYNLLHGDSVVVGNMLLYYSFPQSLSQNPGREQPGTYQMAAIQGVREKKSQPAATPVVPGLSHRPTVHSLQADRIGFEIDMCIGCDRCMVACPLPISSTVTIADLNQATVKENVSSQVAQFTQECIMCGSCVAVCPVDNHRDLLMLSLKQRLGASWESQASSQHVADMLPKGWTVPLVMQRVRLQAALHNPQEVPENYLLHLVSASRFLVLSPGTSVIREGEYGRDLYLILEGRLNLFAVGGDRKEFPVAVLNPGEYVGEDGMLTGQRYNATAKVQTPTLILQVPEQVMQHLMELVPQVKVFFDQTNNLRSLHSILKRMALFQDVANAGIRALITKIQVKQYERDERLFSEKNSQKEQRPALETLHIILEGFVKVTHEPDVAGGTGERVMAYRQGGDYFIGGLDLLGDGKAVTVTTINRVRVAEIPRQTMLALFRSYPEVHKRFTQRLREYVETATVTQTALPVVSGAKKRSTVLPDVPVRSGLQSLVSQGVVEGTEVLIIDLDKCIHCNECEEACERRHGHSRMNRTGKVIGNISITTTCRQCQDPVCMLCSRAGIARLANGEVYITESCIGCGICAERCPYDAISIVDSEGEKDSREEQVSWQRFNNLFARGSAKKQHQSKNLPMLHGSQLAPGPLERPQRDAYDELRKKIAIKCDLCAGYNNQACVDACPTGAALRIQPGEFFGSTEEILQH